MNRVKQISEKATELLMHAIKEGDFAGLDMLPPEQELAIQFQVSRNIIRECLSKLEREGWITRKHGVGTLINKQVVHIKTRLDLNFELSHTLEMIGKQVEIDLLRSSKEPATKGLAAQLGLVEGEEVIRVSRLFKADDKPAVYCIDYLASKLIANQKYKMTDFSPSIFRFMEKFCQVTVETNLTEIRALPATEEVSQALEVPLGFGLLFLSEVGYDMRSKPVLYSEEYFLDRVIPQMIVRKKI
jgi:GntR family transcriptional regulator